jgi:hypothetical protein
MLLSISKRSTPSGRRRFRRAGLGALTVIAASLMGCAPVKPWEKEKLASPGMESPFGKTRIRAEYEDKLMQTKTGGGLPGNAPGGGCGCVQ